MKGGPVSCRGVWIAPWTGDNGERVIYAINSSFRLVTEPVVIPYGADAVAIADGLWDLLDAQDPTWAGHQGPSPRWRLARRSHVWARGRVPLRLVK